MVCSNRVLRANLSKQNVDVKLTSRQHNFNVCKSILVVNKSWRRRNLSKSGDVDAENEIFKSQNVNGTSMFWKTDPRILLVDVNV